MVHGVIEVGSTGNRTESRLVDDGLNVLVVILCYRVAELTVNCLKSIAPQIQDVPGMRVAICENGTGPEAVEQLHDAIIANGWTDWVKLLAVSPNVGFTGGNNSVLRSAISIASPPRYVLLLNADTIVQPGALKNLFDTFEKSPGVGIMGPVVIGTDGKVQFSCFRDHSPVSEFLRGAGSGRINRLLSRDYFPLAPPNGAAQYDWVSFACAMIRSDVLREIGLLDEGYFLYYDDADYCRMARKAGWKIGYCQAAQVVHLEGQSNELPEKARCLERKPRYYYVSRARYFAKHLGTAGLWAANIGWLAGSLLAATGRLISSRGATACQGEWKDIWTNAWSPVRRSNASLVPQESHLII